MRRPPPDQSPARNGGRTEVYAVGPMATSHDDDLERKQSFALRWATSTPAERRAMLREERTRNAPRSARHAMVCVGVLLVVASIAGAFMVIGSGGSGALVAAFGVTAVLCGVAAELGRRGRTRIAFWLIVLAMAGAMLIEALQR